MPNVRTLALTGVGLICLAALWLPSLGAVGAQPTGQASLPPAIGAQAPSTPESAQPTRSQVQSLAALVDLAFANFNILNQVVADERTLNRVLQSSGPGEQIRVAYVGNPAGLNQLLNDSVTLGRYTVLSRAVASNSQAVQAVLRQHNVGRDRVLALDLINDPPTVYVLGRRSTTATPASPIPQATPGQAPSPAASPTSISPNASPSPSSRPRG